MTSDRTLVAPGELRASHLELFDLDRDHLAMICAAPGLIPSDWDGHSDLARDPYSLLSLEVAAAHCAAMLGFLASDVDRLPMTVQWWERIRRWLDSLRTGGPELRYLARRPVHTRVVSRPGGTYLPGGPLVDTSRELDLLLSGAAHAETRAWLEELFSEGDDITGEVERILRESWAGDLLSPEDLYLKILAEYFEPMLKEMDVGADDNPLLANLTDFQRSAYQAAKGILRRYGGVFLSDVVGLGKTYIAMALISWLERTHDQRAVVIGPPAVLKQWEALAEEFRVQLQTVSIGKLDDLDNYSGREVLVVDESHNFRNRSTLRYETLQNWIRPDGVATRKVILLSATPQNNAPQDVQRQLELFPDTEARLPFVGESLDDFFRRVQSGRANLSELLTHVLVRRTRSFIKENYPNTTLMGVDEHGAPTPVPLVFPERISGEEQCLRYRIDEAYGGQLYEEVMTTLRDLRYPLHSLYSFVRPDNQADPRLAGLRQAGASVRGLYRVLLLKRLESSIEAFRISVDRLRDKLSTAFDKLQDEGAVTVRRKPDELDVEGVEMSELIDVPANVFDTDALRAALEHDLSQVTALALSVREERGTDAKLIRLERYLTERPPAEHRTLIFTMFNDTAVYLRERLGDRYGRIALASGSSGNTFHTAQRFAPKALRVQVPAEEQLDLLVSTDVLSEGVNLQDADTLINYDLHWNPVRLIQRAGRIDRIGSQHDEIHVASFMPERGLEANLGLETVLRRRIQEFLEVFGGDSAVLPAAELPDVEGALAAFTGEAFAQAEECDETDGMSRHFERLNAVRRDDPERLDELRAMRPGKRAVSTAQAPAVAAYRLGWHWTFYTWAPGMDGEPTPLSNDLQGLDEVYAHTLVEAADCAPHETFARLVTQARADFEPRAELLRQQRLRPQLSRPEQFILRQLDEYALVAPAARRVAIDAVRQWLLAGQQKIRLQRLGRRWQKNGLHAGAVYQEAASLQRRFPPRDEALGEVELSGIVLGYPGSSE